MVRPALRLSVLLLASLPSVALAQVSLSGTYITYVEVGSNGCMVDSGTSHSMAYTETGSPPTSCDAYYPGSPEEGWTVQATGASGMLAATNLGPSGGTFATTATTMVSGRNITWSGTYTSGTDSIHIDETFSYQMDDRALKLSVMLTNMGTTTLTDVYYLRDTDPDQGSSCTGGTGSATTNDVVLQPPTDSDAFATSGALVSGVNYIIGLGAHDVRARANTSGFGNTNASVLWNAPVDGMGSSMDVAADVVFKEPSIAPGASTTFEIFYVWGTDAATVLSRFMDTGGLPCAGAAGSACTGSGGASGTCHLARCCVGCWDGTRCHGPGTGTACGIGGGSCTDCTDTDPCSSDLCTRATGTCAHPPAPLGTFCDDGLFCTATDQCDGADHCAGAGAPCDDGNPCTAETCVEATHMCSGHVPLPDGAACTAFPAGVCHAGSCCSGCWDGTACQLGTSAASCGIAGAACTSCVDGDQCSDDLCTTGTCSNPFSSTGTSCTDGLFCTTGDHCDGADHCTSGAATPCDDGSTCTTDSCDEPTHMCSHAAATGICAIFGSCFPAGTVNPSNSCQVCDPTRSMLAWSLQLPGTACGTPSCAAAMLTPAPTCSAAGTCAPSARMPCTGGVCASPTMCASTCTTDGDCGSTGYCDLTTGMCAMRLPPGTVCDRTTECGSGVCSADHHCCGAACAAACESCAIPGNLGRCLPVPSGTDPDGECAAGTTCNVGGMCVGAAVDGGVRDSGPATDGGTTDASSATDMSASFDAGHAVDAGMHHASSGGCCSVAGTQDRDGALLLVVLGLAIVAARRRR